MKHLFGGILSFPNRSTYKPREFILIGSFYLRYTYKVNTGIKVPFDR